MPGTLSFPERGRIIKKAEKPNKKGVFLL